MIINRTLRQFLLLLLGIGFAIVLPITNAIGQSDPIGQPRPSNQTPPIIQPAAIGQEVPFFWDFINADIVVQTNGDLLITETQKYSFIGPYSNERYRYIPLAKVDAIEDVSVAENGQVIPSQTGKQGKEFWIRWSHPLKAPESHTFVLKYRVIGGLPVNDAETQLYWKAIFADRKAPINQANVKVHLPSAIADRVTNVQTFGTTAIAKPMQQNTLEFVAQSMPPQTELEVQISFPSDSLKLSQPRWQWWSNNPWVGFFTNPFGLVASAIGGTWLLSAILHRRCPECKTFRLKHNHQTLTPATRSREGQRLNTTSCQCGYRHSYQTAIPMIGSSSGGGGGGGGGGGWGNRDRS